MKCGSCKIYINPQYIKAIEKNLETAVCQSCLSPILSPDRQSLLEEIKDGLAGHQDDYFAAAKWLLANFQVLRLEDESPVESTIPASNPSGFKIPLNPLQQALKKPSLIAPTAKAKHLVNFINSGGEESMYGSESPLENGESETDLSSDEINGLVSKAGSLDKDNSISQVLEENYRARVAKQQQAMFNGSGSFRR